MDSNREQIVVGLIGVFVMILLLLFFCYLHIHRCRVGLSPYDVCSKNMIYQSYKKLTSRE